MHASPICAFESNLAVLAMLQKQLRSLEQAERRLGKGCRAARGVAIQLIDSLTDATSLATGDTSATEYRAELRKQVEVDYLDHLDKEYFSTEQRKDCVDLLIDKYFPYNDDQGTCVLDSS